MSSNIPFTFDFTPPLTTPSYPGFTNEFNESADFGGNSLTCEVFLPDLRPEDLLPFESSQSENFNSTCGPLLNDAEYDDPEWLSTEQKTRSTRASYPKLSKNYLVNMLRSDGYDVPQELDDDDDVEVDDDAIIKAKIAACDHYFQDKSDIFTPSCPPPPSCQQQCDPALSYLVTFNERGPLDAQTLREITEKAAGERSKKAGSKTSKARRVTTTSSLMRDPLSKPRQARREAEEDLTWIYEVESNQPLPQCRGELTAYILRNGNIGNLFPHSISKEFAWVRQPKDDRPGQKGPYILCRGTIKLSSDGETWIEMARCGNVCRGRESFRRHLKTVHLGLARDGDSLDLKARFGREEEQSHPLTTSKVARKHKVASHASSRPTLRKMNQDDDEWEDQRPQKLRRIL